MADDDCPKCHGKGKVQELQKLGTGKLKESPWVNCPECGGTGKKRKR